MKNIFTQQKLSLRLTFNPGLALTSFGTTRPFTLVTWQGVLFRASRRMPIVLGTFTYSSRNILGLSYYLVLLK